MPNRDELLLDELLLQDVPIGSVFETICDLNNLSHGYLSLKGQLLKISEYSELFKIIGHRFSEDQTSTKYFNLPFHLGSTSGAFYIIKAK